MCAANSELPILCLVMMEMFYTTFLLERTDFPLDLVCLEMRVRVWTKVGLF